MLRYTCFEYESLPNRNFISLIYISQNISSKCIESIWKWISVEVSRVK